MEAILYRRPDNTVVLAGVLCSTGEATLLFVPSSAEGQPDSLVIAHDDDSNGIFEDTEMNWFNVEPKDMAEIADKLKSLARSE